LLSKKKLLAVTQSAFVMAVLAAAMGWLCFAVHFCNAPKLQAVWAARDFKAALSVTVLIAVPLTNIRVGGVTCRPFAILDGMHHTW
jgi:hypothetical protein